MDSFLELVSTGSIFQKTLILELKKNDGSFSSQNASKLTRGRQCKMNTTPILEAIDLHKSFKNIKVLRGVNLSINSGICFGLLGPNGAGKTTTIEILEDINDACSGTILFKGQMRKTSFREEIGIQFQHTSLLNFLSVKETLKSFAQLYSDPEDLDMLIERCDLKPILSQKNNKLSGGQQQRLMLALALINKPSLIFLDEPSTGLDPQSRRNLWRIVEQIKQEGKTIILTTHSMEEAEFLCDQIAIMDLGQIIAEGSPEQLIRTHCGKNSIVLPSPENLTVLNVLSCPWTREGDTIRIECDSPNLVIGDLAKADVDLSGMTVSSANLEDVFLRITGKQLRD